MEPADNVVPILTNALVEEFAPAKRAELAYTFPGVGVVPYVKGVAYATDGLSIDALAKRNEAEARSTPIAESGLSLIAGGVKVGLGYKPDGQDEPNIAVMKPAFPLDSGVSGDQPPWTSFYPRVELPAVGETPYSILVAHEEEIVGTKFESYEVEVPIQGTVNLPVDMPCQKTVVRELENFWPGQDYISAGTYRINLEVERFLNVAIRFDGFMPLAAILSEGGARNAMGGIDMYTKLIKDYAKQRVLTSRLPADRSFKGKYIEITYTLTSNEPGAITSFGSTEFQHGGASDKADLVYRALDRADSVQASSEKLFTGLVEVQVGRSAKLHNVDIDFTPSVEPDVPPEDESIAPEFMLKTSPVHYRPFDLHDVRIFEPKVNVGETLLRKPRREKSSPTSDAIPDGHINTFRFCLTNR